MQIKSIFLKFWSKNLGIKLSGLVIFVRWHFGDIIIFFLCTNTFINLEIWSNFVYNCFEKNLTFQVKTRVHKNGSKIHAIWNYRNFFKDETPFFFFWTKHFPLWNVPLQPAKGFPLGEKIPPPPPTHTRNLPCQVL